MYVCMYIYIYIHTHLICISGSFRLRLGIAISALRMSISTLFVDVYLIVETNKCNASTRASSRVFHALFDVCLSQGLRQRLGSDARKGTNGVSTNGAIGNEMIV